LSLVDGVGCKTHSLLASSVLLLTHKTQSAETDRCALACARMVQILCEIHRYVRFFRWRLWL
jgi:hypothetical protein